MQNTNNKLLCCYRDAFDELYVVETIVKMTISACQEREFNGQYYDIPVKNIPLLSAERNNYINMLTLLSERVNNIMNLNLLMEKEIMLLEQNADNSR